MQIKFGTDGWRGVIARDFTFENLSRVAQATMDYLNRDGLGNKGLIIGYDRRFLSRDFARRVAEIAAGNDIRVRLTEDYAPTPAVSWAVRETGSGAGNAARADHGFSDPLLAVRTGHAAAQKSDRRRGRVATAPQRGAPGNCAVA